MLFFIINESEIVKSTIENRDPLYTYAFMVQKEVYVKAMLLFKLFIMLMFL